MTALPLAAPYARTDLRRTAVGARRGDPRYRRITLALAFAGLANFASMYFVQPLLPALTTEFGVSATTSSAALSVAAIAMAVGLWLVGPLSDRYGRRAIMRGSLLLTGLLGVGVALAPAWPLLLAFRGAQGLALAGLPAVALAYLREEVHPDAHLRANSTYIAGTAVGASVGRLLPNPLDAAWGWHVTAGVIAGIALLAAAAMWTLLPASAHFVPRSARFRDVAANTRRTLGDPVLVLLCLTAMTLMGAFVAVYNSIGFRLEAAPFSLGGAAALVYVAYPAGIAAPALARRAALRFGRPRAVLAGVGVMAAGVGLTTSGTLPVVVVGLGLCAVAILGTHSLTTGWTAARAHQVGVGVAQASGCYLVAFYLGSSFFGVLGNARWEAGGWLAVAATALGCCVAAAVTVVLARRLVAPRW